jgi:protein-tyrosine phosphatase
VAPDAIDRGRPLAVGHHNWVDVDLAEEGSLAAAGVRHYFELDPTHGAEPVVVAERRLPLDCCDNFRDLGGYATTDGRRVRWNRVYRSNELSKLTAGDRDYLARLDVKLVCDFRATAERESDPDRFSSPLTPDRLLLPIDQDAVNPDRMQRLIRTGGIAALAVEDSMETAYRAFVTDYSKEWSSMFQRLVTPGNLPTVVHCTAGKDRTGFAAALVLLALGVPEEVVFEDYLLTNEYRRNFFRFVMRWVPAYSLFRTRPSDLLPLLEARRPYLEASLDAIREGYGSVDAYLEQALGVDGAMRAKLQTLLLE